MSIWYELDVLIGSDLSRLVQRFYFESTRSKNELLMKDLFKKVRVIRSLLNNDSLIIRSIIYYFHRTVILDKYFHNEDWVDISHEKGNIKCDIRHQFHGYTIRCHNDAQFLSNKTYVTLENITITDTKFCCYNCAYNY